MRILEVRYITDRKEEIVKLKDMSVQGYEEFQKGKLFCPTPNCSARITFCGGRTPYFKTWNLDKHSDTCPHQFDRIPIKAGTHSTEAISVDISRRRRDMALKEAYKLSQMTEEEQERLKERRKIQRKEKRESVSADRKIIKPNIKGTLSGGEMEEEPSRRGRNIMKRDVNGISSNDIGEIRCVTGFIQNVVLVDKVAVITLEKKRTTVKILFEEAFTADPDNLGYLNNFHILKEHWEKKDIVTCNVIGEIRRRDEQIEIAVYHGRDFLIDNHDMLSLRYA